MLIVVTIFVMLLTGYAFARQGLLTAVGMVVNVLLAGLVAFGLWEPICNALEEPLGAAAAEYSDCVVLVALFSLALLALRGVTTALAPAEPEYHAGGAQAGAFALGLVTGYLVAGFLVCVLQTLPWHQNFWGFEPFVDAERRGVVRRVLPPDRVWLAMMSWASRHPLSQSAADGTDPGFDPNGSFSLRYARHRRFTDASPVPLPYQGETDPRRAPGDDPR